MISLKNFLFPRFCYACQKRNHETQGIRLLLCNTCYLKIERPISILFDKKYMLHALSKYQFPIKKILTAKYARDVTPYTILAQEMIDLIIKNKIIFDVVVAIPQHPLKHIIRWINHTHEMSLIIAEHFKVIYDTSALCNHITQQSQKMYAKRIELAKKNIFSFACKKDCSNLKNKRILIIDDVVTTGSTLRSFIRTLEKEKPQSIEICVVARSV